jgi:hypothetical protein
MDSVSVVWVAYLGRDEECLLGLVENLKVRDLLLVDLGVNGRLTLKLMCGK